MSEFTVHTSVWLVTETTVSADTWEDALVKAKALKVTQLVKPLVGNTFSDNGEPRLECIILDDE